MTRRRAVIICGVVVWAILTLMYLWWLIPRRVLGDLGCEDPPGSSNYGTASWQWWYPGTRCSYADAELPSYGTVHAHVVSPPVWSAVAALVLIIGPAIAITVTRIRRRPTDHMATYGAW